MFPVVSPPIFQIIIRKYLKNGAASGTEWSEPTREKFGKSLCLSGIFQVPLHIVYFIDFGKIKKTALPHNTKLCVAALCCWGKAVFLFCEKAHSFSIFREKSAFTFDFSETRNLLCPNRAKIFSFFGGSKSSPGKGRYYAQTSSKRALHQNQTGKMSACLLSV